MVSALLFPLQDGARLNEHTASDTLAYSWHNPASLSVRFQLVGHPDTGLLGHTVLGCCGFRRLLWALHAQFMWSALPLSTQ